MTATTILTSKLNQLFPNSAKYIALLQNYTKFQSLTNTKKLHAHILVSGLLSVPSFRPIILRSNLASCYAFCGHLPYARHLFDEMPKPTLFLCNAVIKMYSQMGFPCDVLRVYADNFASGALFADGFTYPFVIKACGDLSLRRIGVVLHGKAVSGGFGLNIFVLNTLLDMYMNCGDVGFARRVFDVMCERDVVSWTTMISGYSRNGYDKEALLMFDEMVRTRVEIRRCAVVSVLSACKNLQDMSFGRKVHAIVEEKGLLNDVSICNALIDMYAKCGIMENAHEVFEKMKKKDVVTWTTLINGHVLNDRAGDALRVCQKMHLEGIRPNSVTVVILLQACGSLCALIPGKCLHAWVIMQNLIYDTYIETALIEMYAKCDNIGHSIGVFNLSSREKVGPWNSMISAYMHNGLAKDAICCFKQMMFETVCPDVITVITALLAYARIADARQTCNVHSFLFSCGFLSDKEVIRGLIDLYSKCGYLNYSHAIFDEVVQGCRDVILWSALISSYGMHGEGEIAVSLFKQMVESGIQPNEVAYTCALDACSHAGLVDDGFDLFKLMLEKGQSFPSMHHYTCIVDLLGRAGRLQEAYELIMKMPCQPNHAVWGALLGACFVRGNMELGEIAARSLIDLEPENAHHYVLLANIYAASGRWKDAENTRAMISDVRSGKTPGHSSVEVALA
ncbi:hypothetical protein RND81_08G169100 [Saponaria officinalis]|uniref:Pentatricopeptide repeat-containing protein n=1 Tax=Saponaria officinalis TaxID=3572 RepID=A0AAW1J7P0_SAPOF